MYELNAQVYKNKIVVNIPIGLKLYLANIFILLYIVENLSLLM